MATVIDNSTVKGTMDEYCILFHRIPRGTVISMLENVLTQKHGIIIVPEPKTTVETLDIVPGPDITTYYKQQKVCRRHIHIDGTTSHLTCDLSDANVSLFFDEHEFILKVNDEKGQCPDWFLNYSAPNAVNIMAEMIWAYFC